MTEWRSVVGFEGRYAVSDEGEFMSMDFKGSGLPGLMKTSRHMGGYRQINLVVARGTVKRHLVHRLVAQAFLGECPVGFQVNHINGDKGDNRITNLEYCSPSENKRHAHITGLARARFGEETSQAKLKEGDIVKIRELLGLGMTHAEIAKHYGVSRSNISLIKSGKLWGHVPEGELL